MRRQEYGLGTVLRHLIELLDGDLEALYAGEIPGYRPRFTPIMRALDGRPRQTIKMLAESAGISHSAASQTVSTMVAQGLLDLEAGEQDARERLISLSHTGQAILPALHRRWAQTEAAVAALEAEIGFDLKAGAERAVEALLLNPFRARITQSEPDKPTEPF